MYDMYPWNDGSADPGPDPAGCAGPAGPGPAVSAVQVALDRRDNGGDPADAPGTLPARPARQ